MPTAHIRFASLDSATLEKIKLMEEELGSRIVALEPYYQPAQLTDQQFQKLRAMEQELGVVLLAYTPE